MRLKNMTGALIVLAGALPTANAAKAVSPSVVAVNAIAKYVYPENGASSPSNFSYMPDGESYLLLSDDGRTINRFETATGKQLDTVIDVSHTRESSINGIEGFTISPDGTKLLIHTGKEYIYRRSFKAAFYVFEIKRNILRPLSKEAPMQQAPVFSPDGRMVAFVVDNNIRIKKIDYDSEVEVTTDGVKDRIINGIPDWTYEEEFTTDCSMAWAPDNSTLCYIKYNETDVPKFSFSLYQGYCDASDKYALYPGTFSYKYPVAGEPNSVVSVHSYDVETRKTKEIEFKDNKIEYIPRIAYGGASAERLIVTTLNREQNRMELYSVNPKSTVVKSILVEQSKAWINPMSYENMILRSDDFIIFSERSGYNHLYRYSYNGSLLNQMTSGDYDITAFYGTDAAGWNYYQSTSTPAHPAATAAPLNRIVWRVDRQGKKTELLSPADGWASARFSPAMNYYVMDHSSATEVPVYTLYSTKGNKGKQLRVLEDNREYGMRYASLPKKEFFTMTSDGYTLNGYMLKPADFSASKKYPVIMWQYSGPASQEVVNRWRMDWDYYAAAELGFIVICVDGRGTGGRGAEFCNTVYKRLGHFETIDQVNAARYAASLPYVDADRIGIAGWSFGGYETLMAASATDAPYKAAVAIAPVTSWRYYDSVYTERYMLTPQANAEGYEAGSPVNFTDKMNCRLLIMSGTADDNVHLSNTMEYVSRLQQSQRYCDMFLFPNMNHSIYGCGARALVYGRMLGFFRANL